MNKYIKSLIETVIQQNFTLGDYTDTNIDYTNILLNNIKGQDIKTLTFLINALY